MMTLDDVMFEQPDTHKMPKLETREDKCTVPPISATDNKCNRPKQTQDLNLWVLANSNQRGSGTPA